MFKRINPNSLIQQRNLQILNELKMRISQIAENIGDIESIFSSERIFNQYRKGQIKFNLAQKLLNDSLRKINRNAIQYQKNIQRLQGA